MKEEVSRILKMVEEGKIDSLKASELIETLNNSEESIKPLSNDRMLKIKVSGGKDNVDVNIPIKFLKAIIKATGNIPIDIGGDVKSKIDTQALLEAIDSGFEGKFVDIKSSDGEIVEILIE